jgi:hypothetical protein
MRKRTDLLLRLGRNYLLWIENWWVVAEKFKNPTFARCAGRTWGTRQRRTDRSVGAA